MTNILNIVELKSAARIETYNNFRYCIYREHIIIEDKFDGETMFRIFDTSSIETAAKLYRDFDYVEFDECSFDGAMHRIDKFFIR